MVSLLSLALAALVPVLLYVWLIWNFDYWRKRGVRGPKPKPVVGTFSSTFTQKLHLADELKLVYQKFHKTENYVGVYLLRVPQLVVLEPALVREVFVTAFKHFHDNDFAKLLDPTKDPLVCNNPFLVTGEHWKEQRALITPGMTSSRIKVAYSIMQEVCGKLVAYVQNEIKLVGSNGFDGSALALRFTSENVSASVLGIDAHSFEDNALPISTHMTRFSSENKAFLLYTLIVGLFPNIVNVYRMRLTPHSCEEFFMDLMKRAFKLRRETKVVRQDFLNHLMSLQAKNNYNDDELASHTMTFLIDGLETTGTAIAHCLLLLARYPVAQEKLRQEIIANLDGNGELPYENINESCPYLDACIHESLRLFPPALWSQKVCTEPYEFTNKNGQKLKVEKGDAVILPTYALQSDPTYYDEPEVFKPERFLPENGGVKKYREMGVYYAFGDGPRACLGMRFALIQSKAAVAALVRNFHVSVNPKTEPGIQLNPTSFLAAKNGGVWLDFERCN